LGSSEMGTGGYFYLILEKEIGISNIIHAD
jgi:hypothetical protein